MAGIRRFEDIEAWQLAREMVKAVHLVARRCAIRDDVDLRHQLRRATISTMSNIAEGFGRGNDGDFLRFLDISRGSAVEVQSLLYVCMDLGYLQPEGRRDLHNLAARSLAAIAALQVYLRKASQRRRQPA